MSITINYNPNKQSLVYICNEYSIAPFNALKTITDYCKAMEINLNVEKYNINNKIVFVDKTTTAQFFLELNYGTIVDSGTVCMPIVDMQLSANVIEDILNILKPRKWKVTKHKVM